MTIKKRHFATPSIVEVEYTQWVDVSVNNHGVTVLFKTTFGMETYLDMINDKSTRKHICSFRISVHRLHIERGRYTRPRTSVEERLCSVCKEIEDEFHFMFECVKHRVCRNNLF